MKLNGKSRGAILFTVNFPTPGSEVADNKGAGREKNSRFDRGQKLGYVRLFVKEEHHV